jgi:hypothetical protein
MDLGRALGKAFRAARRGDVEGLEIELAHLKALSVENVVGLDSRLRAMARSARAHPSYRSSANAQAV